MRHDAPHPIVVREADWLAGDVDEGPADHGKVHRVDELRLDVEQRGPAGGIERDLAERAADRGLEQNSCLSSIFADVIGTKPRKSMLIGGPTMVVKEPPCGM